MKQQPAHKLAKAFKTGFSAGVILSFFVYAFARLLFYEFTFTAWEEAVNFFKIIIAGGLMVSFTIGAFLMLEMAIQYIMNLRVYFPTFRFRNTNENNAVADFTMTEVSATT